jgi:hypothetical protein
MNTYMYLFLHACSVGKVAREPQLSEWTERASRCDRLKTPVGLLIILTAVSNTKFTLSLYIIISAWYYGMKILFRLGLLWLESILAYQIPTYLLSRCHYCFIYLITHTVLNQTGVPYLFLPLLSGSFACVSCFGQETCGGLGSFLWSWRFYSRRGQFYLCLIISSFLYLRELTELGYHRICRLLMPMKKHGSR